jgi:two-component system, NarL family, nitrate/nitrite response regulator NarL
VRRGESSLRWSTGGLRGRPTSTGVGGGNPADEPVRVLLVTDVRLHRELLADALAEHGGIELAGSAPSDVAATAAAMFEPSVVIVNTPSAAADELRAFAVALPDAKIVAVGVPSDDDAIVRILEAGAAGYVTAEQSLSDLIAAVEAAAAGELQCPPRLAAALARRVTALAAGGAKETNGNGLTPRQREIATLIAEGLSNKQIARSLSIEHATVKNHVHTILAKLGVSRRDQVAGRLYP